MARIRTIKPEFFTSEQIVDCSVDARLLFVGIWCFCDDGGVHPASVKRLKMEVFPGDGRTDNEVSGQIEELLANGLLIEFEVDGQRFWHVPKWGKHQRIDRPTLKYPRPDGAHSMIIRRAAAEASSSPRDGMESNGMESNGAEHDELSAESRTSDGPHTTDSTSIDLVLQPKSKAPRSIATRFDPGLVPIPESLNTAAFLSAWNDWIGYRRDKRKPLSKRAVNETLLQMMDVGPEKSANAIRTSIANDWQGIFLHQANPVSKPPMDFAGTKSFLEGGRAS